MIGGSKGAFLIYFYEASKKHLLLNALWNLIVKILASAILKTLFLIIGDFVCMPTSFNRYHILLLNGQNLNLLGLSEPKQYGSFCLNKMIKLLSAKTKTIGWQLSDLQSNAEHVVIEKIHTYQYKVDFILINPAAFTHTSMALRDALLAVKIPFIKIHLSNV